MLQARVLLPAEVGEGDDAHQPSLRETIGTWRKPPSCMSRNASSAVACGETVATSVVITFAKVVWSASRPSARTRQTASRSVKMPSEMAPLLGHHHRAHAAVPHALAGLRIVA